MDAYPGTNYYGSSGNYSVTGVSTAIGWLTANAAGTAFGSGMTMTCRLWTYQAGIGLLDLETLAGELCNACTYGLYYTLVAGGEPGAGNGDSIPYQISFATDSHNGTAPLNGNAQYCCRFVEGYNEPNGLGNTPVADTVTGQQEYPASAIWNYSDVTVVGPSVTYGFPYPLGYMTPYFGSGTGSDAYAIGAASQCYNGHLYPDRNPDFDSGDGQNGEMNSAYNVMAVAYGATKPNVITEWHPTLANPSSSINYNPAYDTYYTPMYILSAFRCGYQAYTWWALLDFNTDYTGDGIWETDPTTSNPRATGYIIRAMYSLTGDTGATKHTFVPGKLNYTVAGWASSLAAGTTGTPAATAGSSNTGGQTMLFQNSSGKFFMYVWNSEANPGGTPVNVTINFATKMTSITEYNFSTITTTTPTAVQTLSNANTITVSLAAEVHLLVIQYP